MPASNQHIASVFSRVGDLLARQGADAFRARAWHAAADAIRDEPRPIADVFRDHGRAGLLAIPHVGPRLANALIGMLRTGRCGALDRLEGAPHHELAGIPGLGPRLVARIQHELGIETLDELRAAIADGRLARVAGMGEGRVAALRDWLAGRDAPRHAPAPPHDGDRPPVATLLAIDRDYRAAAGRDELRKIAPRRFNPEHAAWLPIAHGARDGWHYTALFSNTELAHRLGRTHDWVVIYTHRAHEPETQATVVTAHTGVLRGQRVVRGREAECAREHTLRGELLVVAGG